MDGHRQAGRYGREMGGLAGRQAGYKLQINPSAKCEARCYPGGAMVQHNDGWYQFFHIPYDTDYFGYSILTITIHLN